MFMQLFQRRCKMKTKPELEGKSIKAFASTSTSASGSPLTSTDNIAWCSLGLETEAQYFVFKTGYLGNLFEECIIDSLLRSGTYDHILDDIKKD